jgi:hypothetical protein
MGGAANEGLGGGRETDFGWKPICLWAVVSLLLLLQIVSLAAVLRSRGIAYNIFHEFWFMTLQIAVYVVAALVVRLVLQRFFPSVLKCRWQVGRSDLFRVSVEMAAIVLALTLTSYAYSWPKVMVPVLNGSLWDSLLARIDILMCFGINPNEFLLTIFESGPAVACSLLDRYYGAFVASQAAISGWFVTDPRFRRRTAFTTAFIALWIVGAWTYVAVPGLGPIYIYEDFFERASVLYPINAATQAALYSNYQAVGQVMAGGNAMIMPHLGIAAMPSLHVGIHFFLYLWARHVGSRLRPVLLGMTVLTFLGSVALCWHYVIDGVAGLILAGLIFAASAATGRFARWPIDRAEVPGRDAEA